MDSIKLSADKHEFWSHHLQQAHAQGGSLAAYAKQQGLSISAFYYWIKVLRRQDALAGEAATAPVRFSAVMMKPSIATAPANCVVQLSPQITLQCSALPDPSWLAALCWQLEVRP
jgi:hypothetical protein